MLKNFPVFLIVFSGLLSVKRAVAHNEIETPLEVLCSSKLNFQFLEMNFQNERTVTYGSPIFKVVQKKWYPALYRALTKSPISPKSAVGEGAERSHVDRSGVAP